MTPRSILAVTDFSLHGGQALQRAALLCAEHGAVLTLLHLADPREAPLQDAIVRLCQHARQLGQRHGIQAHALTRSAHCTEDMARAAMGADLVVWGTSPARGLRAWFAAHPALRLMRHCPRPVIVVRAAAHEPYRRLLLAVNLSRSSHTVLAFGIAHHPTARVELFHGVDDIMEGKLRHAQVSDSAIQAYRQDAQRRAQKGLLALTEPYQARGHQLATRMAHGDPAHQMLLRQQASGADLLVAGRHAATVLSDLPFEGVAQRLLRAARSDVLVVPHDARPACRTAAIERLAGDLPVRRVRAGNA
jgi:nucleotide-binding universal stress UspA family protein